MRNLFALLSVAIVGTLGVAACSGSGSTKPTGDGHTPEGQSSTEASAEPKSDDACDEDADCVVVETQCCDHCNGGKVESFTKAKADAHKPTDCGNKQCTLMACGEAYAVCKDHHCVAQIRPLTAPPS
jgi:hypothetical protein